MYSVVWQGCNKTVSHEAVFWSHKVYVGSTCSGGSDKLRSQYRTIYGTLLSHVVVHQTTPEIGQSRGKIENEVPEPLKSLMLTPINPY